MCWKARGKEESDPLETHSSQERETQATTEAGSNTMTTNQGTKLYWIGKKQALTLTKLLEPDGLIRSIRLEE